MDTPDDKYQDLIEAYLLEEMDAQEKKDFESRLEKEDELRAAYEEMKLLREEMISMEAEGFLSGLRDIRAELEAESTEDNKADEPVRFIGSPEEGKPMESTDSGESTESEGPSERNGKVRRFPRWGYGVAAAILLLIVPLYLILRPSPEADLFSAYFEAPDNALLSRGSQEDLLRQASQAYEKGDFAGSLVHFDAYLEITPTDTEVIYFSGVAHLGAGKSQEAIPLLEPVSQSQLVYRIPAQWYLGLAHYQAEQTEQARKVWQSLSQVKNGFENKPGSYQQKAREILEELNDN